MGAEGRALTGAHLLFLTIVVSLSATSLRALGLSWPQIGAALSLAAAVAVFFITLEIGGIL